MTSLRGNYTGLGKGTTEEMSLGTFPKTVNDGADMTSTAECSTAGKQRLEKLCRQWLTDTVYCARATTLLCIFPVFVLCVVNSCLCLHSA